MIINAQKEKDLEYLSIRLKNLSNHINKYKKDHGAKIALAKTVYKIKAVTKYLNYLKIKKRSI